MYVPFKVKLVLCIFINLAISSSDLLDVEVVQHCMQQCPLQNHSNGAHYELECSYDCSVNKCVEGCRLWKEALESSCQTVCNGTYEPLSPKELYCVMACNNAVTRYFNQLRAKLGTPIAPALVADSLTATSLRLEWKFPEAKHAGLTYFVQWKYEELSASWQYCRNQTWKPDGTVVVDNLQPYTKYRFRVALLLSPHSEPIVSQPSVVISTLPSGVPASPPTTVRAVPIDCTQISVSWEPGPFPHGPLLSYVLHITDNNGYSALKDIPAENNFYMYRDLTPARNYTISISMMNGVGTGPAAQLFVSTPAEPLAKEIQQPVLILSSHHLVIEQGTDMLEVPIVLYRTKEYIKGIGIHVKQRLLFVSDSSSKVHRLSFTNFTNNSSSSTILSPPTINFQPSELSVDWLNNHLYILGEVTHQRQVWQITRCDLNGRGLQVALAGLRTKPHHIEVDPYNGFLFWVIHGNSGGGLYRLDLSDISNGIKHNVQPEQLLAEPNLGAFTVDHTNFRLLCSSQDQNTINSISLDGKEIVNVRPKVITSKMQKVLSLAMANKTFYWTDGNDVFYEEYHASRESYYHNAYPDLADRPYLKVIVNLPSSQPTPVPINPPTSLQAIFGPQLVKITWKAPHLLGEQGKGAWQNWSYEISVKDVSNNQITVHKNINVTSCTVQNLHEDTEYIITVAAYTSSGKGPPSSEFRGKTLKYSKNGNYPTLLWSATKGLLRSDATGENVHTIIPRQTMKESYITDMAWYGDQIFLVTNNSQIFWHNLNTQNFGQIVNIDAVDSVAIDWIGRKLYWSNPKQQLILRGSFNGTQQEPLPILTLAKELNIDAVQAYLYWSTGHAVECARLNGAERFAYHTAPVFSGKQVMGLTLDMNHNMIYWIIRSSEESTLYRASMMGYTSGTKLNSEAVSTLKKPDMQGPLCYFNDRLLWLKDDKNAVMSDLMGKNIAHINGKELSGLAMIYVMDSSQHIWPNTTNKLVNSISVIPEMIEQNTIKAVGSWNAFNIVWEPCHNVNYGIVFYEIKVDTLLKNGSSKITTNPAIKFWQNVTPFTKLHVTIRAYTYWGTAAPVRAKIYSPPSTPSAPTNLRTFVSHQLHWRGSQKAQVIFRWDAPLSSNGVIQGYKVMCWCLDNQRVDLCNNVVAKANEREYTVNNLERDRRYYFQVQAFTEIGDGDMATLSLNASEENPLPTLFVASVDSLFIHDIDKSTDLLLIHGLSTPLEMTYIVRENKLFWINDMQELLMLNLATLNKSKIIDLTGEAVSLTADWLERSLYYVQNGDGGSAIYKLDLSHADKGILRSVQVLKTTGVVGKIEASPHTRKLYWTQRDSNSYYHIMQSDTDGSNIQEFFSQNKSIYTSCNCSKNSSSEKIFALDHSDLKLSPLLVFMDYNNHNLIASDQEGCNCSVLIESNTVNDIYPLNTLKIDFGMVYWASSNKLYSFRRSEKIVHKEQVSAQDILIYGQHIQRYPSYKCLIPQDQENLCVILIKKAATSLTIKMPTVEIDNSCKNTTVPATEFRIFYIPYEEDSFMECNENYDQIVTFDKEMTVNSLLPFTKYIFCVAVDNYYLNEVELGTVVGPPVVFQTSVGAPTKPENISAIVLNPTLAEVQWLPPKQINGESVWYEIHWQTEGDINGIRQKGEQVVSIPEFKDADNTLFAHLHRLSPNETYSIRVRACTQTNQMSGESNIASSDSDSIQIVTFPEPQNITLINNTADELYIQMNSYAYAKEYKLQYAYLMSDNWLDAVNDSINLLNQNDAMSVSIHNLKPKTQYKFRLLLIYPNYSEPYMWPSDPRYFIFETSGDRPSPPGMPKIQHLKGDVYKVWWEAARENGAQIELYLLEALRLIDYRNKRSTNRPPWFEGAPSIEEQEDVWIPLYNGTETSWIISGLQDQYKYAFRVLAKNSYGWSDPSEESSEFDLNVAAQLAEKQDPINLMVISAIPIIICASIIICFFCCKWYFGKDKAKQALVIPRGPDVELATLRELPRRWIHNTNVLYTTNQFTSDEITMLPHIRRDQITLKKFLGSGAFGEVFEGRAKNINNSETEINVAVKTLRKGASEIEKSEFLQEAQLMSHFKHEHILQLLGVCLDNDPQFIIMELMQGGDLLTYLRSSRNPVTSTPSLNLNELLKMCVDVAKGCRYLEEMHFVHRDLACRNCLVSSTSTEERIVKIGDFGLTRDIYKNDYYRKEGEGLLPVRWMAPESLVDGVFTCQSDVWAFGVLLWEIMTLGQQPYPARNNLEVLHYVKSGGRLGKPINCPDKLHELMLKCWNYEPERRPTFKFCLNMSEDLHAQTIKEPSSTKHEGSYISTTNGTSWKAATEEESDKERTPFLSDQTQKIPTYLELIYDANSVEENDGYEIPRSSITQQNKVLHKSVESSKEEEKKDSPVQSEGHVYVNHETKTQNES